MSRKFVIGLLCWLEEVRLHKESCSKSHAIVWLTDDYGCGHDYFTCDGKPIFVYQSKRLHTPCPECGTWVPSLLEHRCKPLDFPRHTSKTEIYDFNNQCTCGSSIAKPCPKHSQTII